MTRRRGDGFEAGKELLVGYTGMRSGPLEGMSIILLFLCSIASEADRRLHLAAQQRKKEAYEIGREGGPAELGRKGVIQGV